MRSWLFNYDQHHVRNYQSKEEEGLAGGSIFHTVSSFKLIEIPFYEHGGESLPCLSLMFPLSIIMNVFFMHRLSL